MIHIQDAQVESLLSDNAEIRQTLKEAFLHLRSHQAAQQIRMRTEAQGVKLSTLAAVIPDQHIAGAKIYTTINGQFNFVILLFCAKSGVPLATLDAGVITKKRTAATSVLVAQHYANPASKKLALFGLGVQGYEHALHLSQTFPLQNIAVVSPDVNETTLQRLERQTGVRVVVASPATAVTEADIIVTASRAVEPIVKGAWLSSGAFIAAVGSSLPTTRELDDEVLEKVGQIVIESEEQTLVEAGDLLLASPTIDIKSKLVCLTEVLAQASLYKPETCILYKAVGVALEDIALAGLVYKKWSTLNVLS